MRKTIIITAVTFITLLSCSKSNSANWKDLANSDLQKGDFAKVETTLNSLSPQQKEQNKLTIDSFKAIMNRIRYDFSMTPEEGIAKISEKYPTINDSIVKDWKSKKYLETMTIDGKEYWFRKAVRNLWLLNNEDFAEANLKEKKNDHKNHYNDYVEFMTQLPDSNNVRDWRNMAITFTLDVKPNSVPEGEIIRAWLPFPFNNGRQRNMQLISSSSNPTFSKGSLHHTIYMEQAAKKDVPTHFEMVLSYEVGAEVYPADSVLANLKPYNKSSKLYKKYTSEELPHILVNKQMASLAKQIIGSETNPYKQVSKIYDWISDNFPWAGARDYSTLPNIPEYVLGIKHGDCGQVSLLYISLLRSIGIPARWESGWEISKRGTGYHDWTEVYYEGIGWLPSDISHGRSVNDEYLNDFYKTSIDANRFATNEGIRSPLEPKKKFIRCETVDFQAGEVEWTGGNIPSSNWNSDLKINNIEHLSNKTE